MRSYKVYLNIYDFMSYNSCLEALAVGAYHTGVEIDNAQYCYCVVSSDPNHSGVLEIDPQSAEYRFNRKLYLGETMTIPYRLQLIIEQLASEFTCGRYNMFSNNCNHFSNQLAKRLTNVQLPSWIFRSTNILKYLCCCLPLTMVNGQWALQSLLEQEKRKNKEKQRGKQLLLK